MPPQMLSPSYTRCTSCMRTCRTRMISTRDGGTTLSLQTMRFGEIIDYTQLVYCCPVNIYIMTPQVMGPTMRLALSYWYTRMAGSKVVPIKLIALRAREACGTRTCSVRDTEPRLRRGCLAAKERQTRHQLRDRWQQRGVIYSVVAHKRRSTGQTILNKTVHPLGTTYLYKLGRHICIASATMLPYVLHRLEHRLRLWRQALPSVSWVFSGNGRDEETVCATMVVPHIEHHGMFTEYT